MKYILIVLGLMLVVAVYLLVYSMCWVSAVGSRKQDPFFTGSNSDVK